MGRQPLSVEERRDRAIADLRKCYPDGRVERLDALHGHLSERLSRLYKELGYASRQEMIESFGFEVSINKGGRPSSCDPDAVLAELQRRYEGKPKPRATKDLFGENPDLSGKLKTLNNGARTFFGRTLGKELEARGIIERTPARSEPRQTTGRVGRPKKSGPGTEEILGALDDMERRLKDVPMGDRPSTIAGLCRLFPEYEGHVKEGRKRGAFSKGALLQRGILRPPKGQAAAERKQARLSHIRNQELPILLERYKSLGGPTLVARGLRDEALLRDGVLGFDLASMSELRETMLPIENVWPLSVGETPTVGLIRLDTGPHTFRRGYVSISFGASQDGERDVRLEIPGLDEFTSAERFEGETPFKTEAGARVEGTFTLAGIPFAVLRYRFVTPISKETLLYALRALGVSVV